MNKLRDFSDELAAIADNVETDVGSILKIVREQEEAGAEKASQSNPTETNSNADGIFYSGVRRESSSRTVEKRPRSKGQVKATLNEQVILENVTTRLRRDTNELLTESALHQKLKKSVPATRQDIVEDALKDWFAKHGYRSA